MGKRDPNTRTLNSVFNFLISSELGRVRVCEIQTAWPAARLQNRRSHRRMPSRCWGNLSSRRWSSWSPALPVIPSLSLFSAPTLSWPRAALSPTIFARLGSLSALSGMTPAPSSSPPATSKVISFSSQPWYLNFFSSSFLWFLFCCCWEIRGAQRKTLRVLDLDVYITISSVVWIIRPFGMVCQRVL